MPVQEGNASFFQIRSNHRHGAGSKAQSSDGTGNDGHGAKYNSGVLTDNGNVDAYAVDTGSANNYAFTLTPSVTLVAGDELRFKAVSANTGASTIALNGGSTVPIKKNGATALASGDIAVNQIVLVVYDGTNWQMIAGGNIVGTGVSGGGGGSGSVVSEIPSGTLDGVNTVFTTSHTPVSGSVIVYKNGVEQDQPRWCSVSGSTITFVVAPLSYYHLYVSYEL